MRTRWLHLLPILVAVLIPAAASANADRAVVEDGTNALTAPNNSTVFTDEQGSTTLVPHTCAANSCTRAAPAAATEGLVLTGISAYRVQACVSSGTLNGGGAIEFWVYNIHSAQWAYVNGADLSLVGTSGKTCATWSTKLNTFKASEYRLVARSNAVTTSAATPTLTVRIDACKKSGCGS